MSLDLKQDILNAVAYAELQKSTGEYKRKTSRLNRIVQVFHDYDYLVNTLALRNGDYSCNNAHKKLREEVSELIKELERYGCRRKF